MRPRVKAQKLKPFPMSSEAPTKKPWRGAALTILKCVLAAALLLWLIRSGRLDGRAFANLKPSWALAGVLGWQAAMLFCIAARWHFLTRALRLDFPFSQTLRISCIGFYAAILTPASLGLDGVRLLMSRRLRPAQSREIVASVLWDRVLGVWSLLVLSALGGAFLIFSQSLTAHENVARSVFLVALGCGALALVIGIFLLVFIAQPKLWASLSSIPFLKKRGVLQQSPPREIFGWPLFFAFATHACNILATFGGLSLLERSTPFVSTVSISPFVILSSLVPLTPLGLGVTDAAAALLFSAVGAMHGAAATMILRTSFVLLSLVCGLMWLWPVKISDLEPEFPSPSP